jgi:cytochrome b
LGTFLLNISQSLSVLAIFIAVLAIVYAGVLMVSDNGGGENVGKAKKIIANAVIGLVISLLAFTIVYLVASITSSPTLLQNVFK